MNESIWKEQLNTKLQEEFNFELDLPAVFIDTFHNREKQDEVDKFSENTQLLWAFAESKLGINYPVSAAVTGCVQTCHSGAEISSTQCPTSGDTQFYLINSMTFSQFRIIYILF